MSAGERSPMRLPSAFYKCEEPRCAQQRVWQPHELRWSPGGKGSVGGFSCQGCYEKHSRDDGWQGADTLAMVLAQGHSVVGGWNGTANSVRLSIVGTLAAIEGVTFVALLDTPLVDDDGESQTWQITVAKEWGDTEYLPDDLVRVEGCIGADGECDPFLNVERVDLLRQGIEGAVREKLLACSDAEERWNRADRLATERYFADRANRIE